MFDSISDEEIAENKGKTFQDITALRDPLMGLGYGDVENPFDLATDDEMTVDYSPDQPRDKDGKWTGGGLNSGGENLKEHFNNHGHQYANMTAEDYNNYALDLIQQPVSNDVLGYKTAKGAVVRYKVSTNDYVKGYPNTGIATMYKPKGNKLKGYAYYKKLETSEGITND